MTFNAEHARQRIQTASEVIASLADQLEDVVAIAETLSRVVRAGGVIYTCGNGGSAAEALHLAEEMVGKYDAPRRPLPAVCLGADPTALTCIANDFGFDEVFARPLEALARAGDALVVFSTSGKSPNLLRALEVARKKEVARVGLLGKGGGPALELCDAAIVIDSDDSGHVQEAHQALLHIVLEALESEAANPEGHGGPRP